MLYENLVAGMKKNRPRVITTRGRTYIKNITYENSFGFLTELLNIPPDTRIEVVAIVQAGYCRIVILAIIL